MEILLVLFILFAGIFSYLSKKMRSQWDEPYEGSDEPMPPAFPFPQWMADDEHGSHPMYETVEHKSDMQKAIEEELKLHSLPSSKFQRLPDIAKLSEQMHRENEEQEIRELEEERRNRAPEFDLRKAVIYSEILNRKYAD